MQNFGVETRVLPVVQHISSYLLVLVDTANTEKGDLSITINEGRVPVQVFILCGVYTL